MIPKLKCTIFVNLAKAKVVITANERMAGGHCLPLKAVVDEAVEETEVEVVLVAHRTPNEATLTQERDLSLEEVKCTADVSLRMLSWAQMSSVKYV